MRSKLICMLLSSVVIFTEAIIVRDNEFEYSSGERHYYGNQGQQQRKVPPPDESPRANGLNFHEVDAFGDDFVDFGAQTGPFGAFTWHANYPVEDQR
ncbi:uncharacterized protein LOC128715299 [Anopheles marshallii]|uniref:uncharacterized protein LOC128715299 n=1 Tax=Anopheles marshallii TaxID=1521116 RepID=UPI00237A3993|nr:uncharacterized protein LOC128715299 [Anopheles marshallii]